MIDILDKTGYPISKGDKVTINGYTHIYTVYDFSSIPNQEVLTSNHNYPGGTIRYANVSPNLCEVIIENDPVEFVERLPI